MLHNQLFAVRTYCLIPLIVVVGGAFRKLLFVKEIRAICRLIYQKILDENSHILISTLNLLPLINVLYIGITEKNAFFCRLLKCHAKRCRNEHIVINSSVKIGFCVIRIAFLRRWWRYLIYFCGDFLNVLHIIWKFADVIGTLKNWVFLYR